MAKGPLTVLAYSQDDKIKLDQGTLLLVNNEILQTTGTIQLKATVSQHRTSAVAGRSSSTSGCSSNSRKDGLTVAASAVQQGQSGSYAYVIGPTARRRCAPSPWRRSARARR